MVYQDGALKLTSKDWAIIAILNVVEALVVGAIISAIVYLALKGAYLWNANKSKMPIRFAIFSFIMIATTAVTQGIIFYINKPFM